jgi:ATP-binding cassette subfamily B protein
MPRYCVGPAMAVGMLMMALQAAGPALIMGFGGWLVLTGRTTVGTVVVFATVLGMRLAGSLSSLAAMHVNVTRVSESLCGG